MSFIRSILSLYQISSKSSQKKAVEDPFHYPEVLIKADGSQQKFPLHGSTIAYNFENSAGLVYEALEVARCIKEGLTESPRMSHRDSLVLAKLMDAVRKQVGVKFYVDDKEFP